MLPQEHQNYRILATLALALFLYECENITSKHFLKHKDNEDVPGSPRLRFYFSNAGDVSSTPSQGTKISHAK